MEANAFARQYIEKYNEFPYQRILPCCGAAPGVARKSADGPASVLNEPFDERVTDDARRADNESVIGHRTTQP
jgi:hypothetical protein